jgi:hypothetical protein
LGLYGGQRNLSFLYKTTDEVNLCLFKSVALIKSRQMKTFCHFKKLSLIVLLMTTWTLKSQDDSIDKNRVEVKYPTEIPAEFPEGQNELMCYIESRLTSDVLTKTDTGTIILTALLDKQGQVNDIEFNFSDNSKVPARLKPISDKNTEKQVRQIFENMPAWQPKFKNEQAVESRFTWLIKFSIPPKV